MEEADDEKKKLLQIMDKEGEEEEEEVGCQCSAGRGCLPKAAASVQSRGVFTLGL